jgi:ribosome-interacting GTPase 1
MNLILKALEKTGIKINKSKYTFHVKKMKFLGYIVGSDRIKMDSKKVQAV